MWRRGFFVVCYALLCMPLSEASSVLDIGHHSLPSSNLISEAVTKFKVDFHHSLQAARIRKKRETGLLRALTDENTFVEEHLRVGSSEREDLPYLADYNLTFWTSFHHQGRNGLLVGTAKGDLVLFELKNRIATTVARSIGEDVGYKAKAFSHFDQQWFAILQPGSRVSHLRLYERVGRGLERRQTFNLEGASDFDLLTVRGVHYLVVATYEARTMKGYTYQARVALYHWTRTQFDVIASRITYGARSVACWVLDGSLYISVAQEINDDRNLFLGSPVFLYNAKEESDLVLVETLGTKAPRKCAHFFVSGSHYLIFIGQFDAVVYWWAGNQFLEWQTIPRSAGAVDVSVLNLSNGEVIIAIALKMELMFFTLDAAGYYTLTYRMKFSEHSLFSLQFMWNAKDYFALTLFEASAIPPPHPTWILRLETYNLLKDAALDPLLLCLSRVQNGLEDRETEIEYFNNRVNKVWLLDREQEIPGNVAINGTVRSERFPLKVEVLQIKVTEVPIPSWTTTNVAEELGKLSSSREIAVTQMSHALLKSTAQTIYGKKNFTGLLKTPSFSVKKLHKDFSLNGIPMDRLLSSTLKISGKQIVTGKHHLKELSVETADVSLINGLNTSDFLLLNGNQLVKGRIYFSDVRATDMETGTEGVLNSIKVKNLITSNSEQEIRGMKSFLHLQSQVIDVHGQTNGENLSEIHAKLLRRDEDSEIRGSFQFTKPVDVEGDMFISGLVNNAVNITHMLLKGVNKYSTQEITGSKVFLSSVYVNENMHLDGTLNGIRIQDLVTRSTPQLLSGDLRFLSPVTFESDVLVDLLNSVDLDNQAVLKLDDQFIEGQKTFTNRLEADEIQMTDFMTLDYVDPSELAKTLVHHENGVINDTVVISNAIVHGNLNANEGINDFPVNDLPKIMYLKSKQQEIDVPVFFPGTIGADYLDASFINFLNLDTDVVHSYGDEVILSTTEFQSDVQVNHRLQINTGTFLNDVDISSFSDQEPLADNAVHGEKVLKSLQIMGNIQADFINGLDFTRDVMMINEPQTVEGSQNYTSTAVAVTDLRTRNIIAELVNHINLREFFADAVLNHHPDSRVIRNKTFTELKASSLSIPAMGRIDGVFIPEMLLRAVTLNTYQYINTEKTFTGFLQFLSPISSTTTNDLDLVSHVHRIVFLDTLDSIQGWIRIHGDVHFSDLTLKNLLNNVNITSLATDALYKSRKNRVTSFMRFSSDLHIESLIVKEPATIDGVNMNDVVLVRENVDLNSAEIHENVFITGNINVEGLLNGCDLKKVMQDAVKINGDHQVLSGKIQLTSLNVTGSVTFRDTVSDINATDLLKMVTRSGLHVIHGNFHFGSGIRAVSLNLKGPVQGVDLTHILKDSVRKSVPQTINSVKTFRDDLEMGDLKCTELFVTKSVNGVNLQDLFNDVVWRNERQVIHGEKILGTVHVNNVTLHRYLNGLRFPEDVVLTSTSERIPGSVKFMKDLIIEAHLIVNGRIDGVDLKSFLNQRLTTKAEEEFSAQLTFKKDLVVDGNLFVDGAINDVVLEMVVKSYNHNTITGLKTFNKDLSVQGSLQTGLVNGYNFTELLSSLLRLSTDEHIEGWQLFTQPIHLNSPLISMVNGISLHQLENEYRNISDAINRIENLFEIQNIAQQDQIANQMANFYPISDFAFFVKVQELNFGSVEKISIGSRIRHKDNSYQNMVMWVTQSSCVSTKKCCDSTFSYWLEAGNTGFITAKNEPEEGKYFTIDGPNLFSADGNIVVWTNSSVTQPSWCRFDIHGTVQIGFLDNHLFQVSNTLKSSMITAIKAFRERKLYIVVSYFNQNGDYSRSMVYLYNKTLEEWEEHQQLPEHGVLALDVTSYKTDTTILLAMGTGSGSYPNSELVLYQWSDTERMFIEMNRILSDSVTSVLWIDNRSEKLLVVSSVERWSDYAGCSEEVSGGQLDVFRYDGNIKRVRSIQLRGIVSVVSFTIADELFLAAASREMDTVYILQLKGFSGFTVVQSIISPGVRHLTTYHRQNEIFVVVASATGPSFVLKAVVRGGEYFDKLELPVELADAPSLNQPEC